MADTSHQHCVEVWGSAKGVADRGDGIKRGTRGCVLIIEASHYSASLGKYTLRFWKRRVRRIVEPQIEEEECGFRPGHGMTDQLFTLSRILEGAWEYAYPVYMCFVDLEKAYDWVPPGDIYCRSIG